LFKPVKVGTECFNEEIFLWNFLNPLQDLYIYTEIIRMMEMMFKIIC
jgi:hypothetical protein